MHTVDTVDTKPRIYIIGAGWYGCHIASRLLVTTQYTIHLIDCAGAIFQESSAKNQNRLHLGYHYPRSLETINECRRGFQAFLSEYGHLTRSVPLNTYIFLPLSHGSFTDSAVFEAMFPEVECVADEQIPELPCGAKAYRVDERYIDPVAAANHFESLLKSHLLQASNDSKNVFESLESICSHFGIRRGTDIILDCTYNQLRPGAVPFEDFELFLTFLYRFPDSNGPLPAYTVMDGPFFSLYPYNFDERLCSLTSVREGVVWRGRDRSTAPSLDAVDVQAVRQRVEAEVARIFPACLEAGEPAGYFFSWKTKPVTNTDDRSLQCRSSRADRILHVYGGKITGIFDAERTVQRFLAALHEKRVGLVGWTGFVGQTLFRHLVSKGERPVCYNSSNVGELRGQHFDTLYLSCLPANKWWANLHPTEDRETVEAVLQILETVSAQRVVLISTVDVLDCRVPQTESGTCWSSHAYGENRRLFEEALRRRFGNHLHILRLPGLFGRGLKKNVLFDMLNGRYEQLRGVHVDSTFQWYSLDWLGRDVDVCVFADVQCMHLVSEPIAVRDLLHLFPDCNIRMFADPQSPNTFNYTLQSEHGSWISKTRVMNALCEWLAEECRWLTKPFRVAASVIGFDANDVAERNASILMKNHGVDALEIVPARGCTDALVGWKGAIVSMQALLWGTHIHVFDPVKGTEPFVNHLVSVIFPRAKETGVHILVFGSPQQRHLHGTETTVAVALFRHLGDLARQEGLVICLEPGAPAYGCTWLTCVQDTLAFLEHVGHPNVLLNLDSGNYALAEDTFPLETLPLERVGHIQISCCHLVPCFHAERDRIAAERVLTFVGQSGYRGAISYEARSTGKLEDFCEGLDWVLTAIRKHGLPT